MNKTVSCVMPSAPIAGAIVSALHSLNVERMLVQGDRPNEWLRALPWQKTMVNAAMNDVAGYWEFASHIDGTRFSAVHTHRNHRYRVGWKERPTVIVNVDTGRVRELFIPTPPNPRSHRGARTHESSPYFAYAVPKTKGA